MCVNLALHLGVSVSTSCELGVVFRAAPTETFLKKKENIQRSNF